MFCVPKTKTLLVGRYPGLHRRALDLLGQFYSSSLCIVYVIYSDAAVDVLVTVGKAVFMATNILMRDPLSSATNHSNSPPPSPPTLLGTEGKAPPVNEVLVGTSQASPTLRRRDTVQNLINLDSSESYPSLHSSLYDASFDPDSAVGGTHSEDEWIHTTGYNEPPPAWANTVCSTSGDIVPASFLEPILSQKLHSPHKLSPIIEQQRSFATLQISCRSGSLNNRPSTLTLHSGRSHSPGLNGKRQKSFSMSDLPEQATTELPPTYEASPPASVRLVPHPNQPLHPPPMRSSTPPNLPRFGTLEACTYRLPRPRRKGKTDIGKDSKSSGRKKEKKSNARLWSSTAEVREWRRQTVSLPKNVIMRGDDGTLVKGKFMPTNSGHNGPVMKAGPRGGLGNGNIGRSPYIAPDVSAATHLNERGTRATWTDAVMTGGIGAGPGIDARYTTSALRTQRDQLDRETRRKMKMKRKAGFEAWKAFLGLGVEEDEIGNDRCCVCSKRMWWFCPLFTENEPLSEADMAARPVLLQNGV